MYGVLGLFFWSMAESVFFPIPPDALLMGLILLKPELGLIYGFVATLGSIIGAVLGYSLGRVCGRPLLQRWMSEARIVQIQTMFGYYDVWAVISAAVTPIPYKLVAISAGVFHISLYRFVVASLFGRGLRFTLLAYLVIQYGSSVVQWVSQYFDQISLAVVGITLVVIFLWLKVRQLLISRDL